MSVPELLYNSSREAKWHDRFQVPKDKDALYENDSRTNRDLIPIPKERRTWGIPAYTFYWLITGNSVSGFSIAASLLAYGLTPAQSLACMVAAGCITGIMSCTNGWMGTCHRIGFTVASRFTYGMRGTYCAVILRAFFTIFWVAIQAFFGGSAIAVCIGAIWPSFNNITSHIDPATGATPQNLTGYVIYFLLFCGIAFVPPEKLVIPFIVFSLMFTATCFGLVGWSVKAAGGPGSLWSTPATTTNTSQSIAYGITAILAAYTTGMLAQSDLTRYSKGKYTPTLSQLIAAPVFMVFGAALGIIAVSAAEEVLGDVYWEPWTLLSAIQVYYNNSSGARAGVFFAGAGIVAAQLILNVAVNSLCFGMDIAGLMPKWINIKRGQLIAAFLSWAVVPWTLLASATTFLTFLGGSGVFIAPMMALQIADYLVVRRRTIDMDDLYTTRPGGVYWFWHGFNFRPFVAFFMGVWPHLPGLAMMCKDPTTQNGWVTLFSVSFFTAFGITFVVHLLLNWIVPPSGLGQGITYVEDWQATGEHYSPSALEGKEFKPSNM